MVKYRNVDMMKASEEPRAAEERICAPRSWRSLSWPHLTCTSYP